MTLIYYKYYRWSFRVRKMFTEGDSSKHACFKPRKGKGCARGKGKRRVKGRGNKHNPHRSRGALRFERRSKDDYPPVSDDDDDIYRWGDFDNGPSMSVDDTEDESVHEGPFEHVDSYGKRLRDWIW